MTDKIVVLTTCGSEDDATRLARTLVDLRLAACVSVAPQIRSIYRWQGAIEQSSEVLLIIKTSRGLFRALHEQIAKLHTYEVPELIALPIVDGASNYLDWLGRELAEPIE